MGPHVDQILKKKNWLSKHIPNIWHARTISSISHRLKILLVVRYGYQGNMNQNSAYHHLVCMRARWHVPTNRQHAAALSESRGVWLGPVNHSPKYNLMFVHAKVLYTWIPFLIPIVVTENSDKIHFLILSLIKWQCSFSSCRTFKPSYSQ